MTRIELRLAKPEDDPDLRKILCENPIAGDISLSFEREPNYFIAAQVEAPDYQIIVGKDLDIDRVIGMGARSIRSLYINGKAKKIGYLSQFRIDQNYRAMRKGLMKAWQFFKKLNQDGKSPFYYTSIIENNLPARRLLTRGLPGLPKYTEYSRMNTLAIYSRRKKKNLGSPRHVEIKHGNDVEKTAIIECLQRNLPRYQFAPLWDETLLFTPKHTPGLAPEDFIVAVEGDKVVGCIALWNQGGYKQTVVRGYSKIVKYFRWAINLAAIMFGFPVLPPIGEKINHAYASHLAIDEDDLEIYQALIRKLYNHAVKRDYSYFMLGLCDHHPFFQYTKKEYAHLNYKSIIYLVSWNREADPKVEIDDRLPNPEIAIL